MSISRPSAPLVTVVNRIATSAEHARELLSDRTATSRSDRFTSIVWKNSQNDRSRKSRFRAPNLICAGNRHDEAHGRATRGKIARAAEGSRPSMWCNFRVWLRVSLVRPPWV
jgi:hypothetical protein